jgi:hypothetical protein
MGDFKSKAARSMTESLPWKSVCIDNDIILGCPPSTCFC